MVTEAPGRAAVTAPDGLTEDEHVSTPQGAEEE